MCGCPAGGVYAVGYARHGFKGGFEDALVTRYNAAGSRTLTKRYGVVGPSKVLTDVAVDPKGRIAVCGSWTRDRVGFYVALLRPAGTVVWSHRYDRGQGARLVIDGKGRVTASGTAVSPSGYPVVAGVCVRDQRSAALAFAIGGRNRFRQAGDRHGPLWVVQRLGVRLEHRSGLPLGASCILDGGCDSRADSRRLVV